MVGCGGTGAYVAGHLARFQSGCSRDYGQSATLTLVDGDVVEKKNLVRQHFVEADIGKNKAEALAERYSSAFGIEIGAVPHDLEKTEDITKLLPYRSGLPSHLVISCVDNNATRKIIYDALKNLDDVFWIDSGNEETSGQVVCGFFPRRNSSYYYSIYNASIFSLPCAVEVYPNLLDDSDKFNSALSCAERAISAPQNMMTNITAATIVLNFAQTVLTAKEIASHGVEFGIWNAFTTRLNTPENLKCTMPRRRDWETKT